ncbi:expressed unknown protein [Seminavis robusta]|uniref:RXYLT1 C-terminal domain-containing protein n=1 Tax=Seminavis robusta TaxID=568900 RepID=A0A9N8ES88_9STRA|nr:expressed unknown protein [Seminavis robusta]|eukprot:Sro1806_g298860.1 n/a (421) ;mRNA; f:6298-7560
MKAPTVHLHLRKKALVMGLFAISLVTSIYHSYLSLSDVIAWADQQTPEDRYDGFPISLENNAGTKNRNSTTISDSEMSTSLLAKQFYENHYASITTLINKSTALLWKPRSENPFAPFKDELENPFVIPWRRPVDFRTRLDSSHYIVWRDICSAVKAFHKHRTRPDYKPLPQILTLRMNENWGEFSEYIPNRTTDNTRYTGLTGEQVWRQKGCTRQDILAFLDHDDTRAVVTTQHSLLDHPKIFSLPLGLMTLDPGLVSLLRELRQPSTLPKDAERPQLLMVNSNPRPMRVDTINTVLNNFQALGVKNTYNSQAKNGSKTYAAELRRSKFILSPSGMGLDCYRHWEAIHMGTIPVLEHLNRTTDAWFRTLGDLPVAWIDSFDNLTPEFLQSEYKRIMGRTDYNYQKLTRQWWIHRIKSTLL